MSKEALERVKEQWLSKWPEAVALLEPVYEDVGTALVLYHP